jgi:hypothetical protein
MTERQIFAALFLVLLLVAAVVKCANEGATNHNLPLVQASAHGFVCTPTITPRLRPVRSGDLA